MTGKNRFECWLKAAKMAGGREREAGAPLYKEEELKRAPAGQVASSLLERLIFEPLPVQGDLATIFSLTSLDLFHVK